MESPLPNKISTVKKYESVLLMETLSLSVHTG